MVKPIERVPTASVRSVFCSGDAPALTVRRNPEVRLFPVRNASLSALRTFFSSQIGHWMPAGRRKTLPGHRRRGGHRNRDFRKGRFCDAKGGVLPCGSSPFERQDGSNCRTGRKGLRNQSAGTAGTEASPARIMPGRDRGNPRAKRPVFENIPPKRAGFSEFISIFAMSVKILTSLVLRHQDK